MLFFKKLFLTIITSSAILLPLSANAGSQCGSASFYHDYYDGRTTSSGTTFSNSSTQAAHPWLPFGTRVTVTKGGRSTVVRITDRGPFSGGRIIDLSKRSFGNIASLSSGVVSVCLSWK